MDSEGEAKVLIICIVSIPYWRLLPRPFRSSSKSASRGSTIVKQLSLLNGSPVSMNGLRHLVSVQDDSMTVLVSTKLAFEMA